LREGGTVERQEKGGTLALEVKLGEKLLTSKFKIKNGEGG